MMDLAKLCTPAKVYLALFVLGSIFALINRNSLMHILLKLVFALLWTYVLNYLCRHGLTTLSWILVLLPIILYFISLIFLVRVI